jgi:hypothetical protein
MPKKLKKIKKQRPLSPFRAFLRDAWAAMKEEIRYNRAMKNLSNLEWSTDYLIYLMKKADNDNIQLRIENNGIILTLSRIKDMEAGREISEQERLYREYIGVA